MFDEPTETQFIDTDFDIEKNTDSKYHCELHVLGSDGHKVESIHQLPNGIVCIGREKISSTDLGAVSCIQFDKASKLGVSKAHSLLEFVDFDESQEIRITDLGSKNSTCISTSPTKRGKRLVANKEYSQLIDENSSIYIWFGNLHCKIVIIKPVDADLYDTNVNQTPIMKNHNIPSISIDPDATQPYDTDAVNNLLGSNNTKKIIEDDTIATQLYSLDEHGTIMFIPGLSRDSLNMIIENN